MWRGLGEAGDVAAGDGRASVGASVRASIRASDTGPVSGPVSRGLLHLASTAAPSASHTFIRREA